MRVSTSMRTFTNWLEKSEPSVFGNSALSLTVPVVGSIWLSTVISVPAASRLRFSRSQASTASFSVSLIRRKTSGRLSCGIVKITATGCSWVITTRPFASPARTTLPWSTWRRPRRPLIGAVTRE